MVGFMGFFYVYTEALFHVSAMIQRRDSLRATAASQRTAILCLCGTT